MATDTTAASSPVRPRSTSGDVVDRLGAGAHCVYLFRPPGVTRTARLALELAQRIGRRRPRTLLLHLGGDDGELDRLLGLEDVPGLTAAFRGRVGVVDAAVRREGWAFHYLPAGRDAAPPEALLSSRSMDHLLRRVRAGQGTALLYVSAAPLVVESARADVDGCFLLGDAPPSEAPASVPLLARARRPSPRGDGDRTGSRASGATDEANAGTRGDPRADRDGGTEAGTAVGAGPAPVGEEDPVRTPVGSGAAVGAPGLVGIRPKKMRWGLRLPRKRVLLVCGIALALGVLISWEGAHDLLQQWLTWSAEVRSQVR